MESWYQIGQNLIMGWTAFIIVMCALPSMRVHIRRLFDQGEEDQLKGHALVNVFAEILRILRVPEKVIKFRLPLVKIGLPQTLSFLPPFVVFYVITIGANISKWRK